MNLKQRVELALSQKCRDDHELYEECLNCHQEALAIIKELTEREKTLVDALKFYTNAKDYERHYGKYYEDAGKIARNTLSALGVYAVTINVFGKVIDYNRLLSVTDAAVSGTITQMTVSPADGHGVNFYEIEGKTAKEVWAEIHRQIKENSNAKI